MLKSIHLLGAFIFLGNIIVSALWKVMADRTKNTSVIQYACRLVNITDIIFTGLGATLLLVSGHVLAVPFGGISAQQWILQSYILFVISGIIWIATLVPIQIKQTKLTKNLNETEAIPEQYYKLARLWSVLGTIATIVPIPAIFIMINK